ncbi:MAG: hypothetical protein WCI71_00935, partial [Bacteroidota bacterium]
PPFYDQGHGSKPDIAYLLMKLRTNPKLRMLIVAGGIIILVVLIIVVIALLPLIIKLFDYISTVGIQGIYDQGVAFLDKLWKGSGK